MGQEDGVMAKHLRFHLVYDGPALAGHRMDVRDLAPALLAMNSLFERANSIINGEQQAQVSLNVHASFKSGSFGIDLELAQSLWQRVLDFANSHHITGILQIAGLLGIGHATSKGVIQVIAWLRGRGIKKIEPIENGGLRLFVDDEYMDVEEQTLNLIKDYKIRHALEGIVFDPLRKQGIESVSIVDIEAEKVLVSIDRDQAHYFKAPAVEEETLETEDYIDTLQVLTLAFQDGNKWRFTEGGGNAWYAVVRDDTFLSRVQFNQEHFAKDDIIKARIRRTQRLGKDGLKADYEILEVLEHRRAAPHVQLRLGLETDSSASSIPDSGKQNPRLLTNVPP